MVGVRFEIKPLNSVFRSKPDPRITFVQEVLDAARLDLAYDNIPRFAAPLGGAFRFSFPFLADPAGCRTDAGHP